MLFFKNCSVFLPCLCVSHSVVSNSLRPPWTLVHLAPLSVEFSRQEYWNGFPFPSSGALPDPGIEPWSPALQADSLPTDPVFEELVCTFALFTFYYFCLKKEESQRKKIQEINNQKANHKIEELEKAKQRFEQEIHVNRKRLEMEALATKQVTSSCS